MTGCDVSQDWADKRAQDKQFVQDVSSKIALLSLLHLKLQCGSFLGQPSTDTRLETVLLDIDFKTEQPLFHIKNISEAVSQTVY